MGGKFYDNPKSQAETGEYSDALPHGPARGRGANLNPGNRHETVRLHVLGDFRDHDLLDRAAEQAAAASAKAPPDLAAPAPPGDFRLIIDAATKVATRVYPDRTRSILTKVDSPDLMFGWSMNPYRGCEHGCIYCYARPDHERLGFSCGLDFETRIMAKFDAPTLLRKELASPKWKAESIMLSGDTDCFQPIERELRITRGCLEVLAECHQPVSVISKNKLVTRDLDLFQKLHHTHAVRVAISLTTLDNKLAAKMEPRASAPAERLAAIRELSAAGIPVSVMTAPIIPAINDREIPALLEAAAAAGATSAGYVLVRLPHQIKDLFLDWLQRHFPDRAAHVESLIRQTHHGQLYDSTYGKRQTGEGPIAQQIKQTFQIFKRKHKLNRSSPISNTAFRPPIVNGQLTLFD